MRANGRPRWRAALLGAATLVSAGLLAITPTTPANADPGCKNGGVLLVFARGSGAGFNSGEFNAFKNKVGAELSARGISWDVVQLGDEDGDGVVTPGGNEYPAVPWQEYTSPQGVNLLNLDGYGASVAIGTNGLVYYLNNRVQACPTETYVLGGYSQGADVVGWALERQGNGALNETTRSRIGFVALYGDPKFKAGAWEARFSGILPEWVRGNDAGWACTGAPGVPGYCYARDGVLNAREPYVPVDFQYRVGSWCDQYDGICTGTFLAAFNPGSHGTTYGQYWIEQSAAEVANAAALRLYKFNSAPTNTASSTDQQFGGDYNGDGYGDVAMLHKSSAGGVDVHMLYGSTGTPFQNTTTIAKQLTWPTWDWNKVKAVSGRFNSDANTDLALFYQRSDGGMDVHVFYGGSTPFAAWASVRNMTGAQGWNWNNSKLVSGDFNGDHVDDVAVCHLRSDGGTDVHILYGSVGTPFTNRTTLARQLPASQGWSWPASKFAAGMFNADEYADLVVAHQSGDGGIDLHLLYGATGGYVFTNTITATRQLPGSAGWSWSAVKLAAGFFNSDGYADIALLHQLVDGGIGVHIVYGGVGTPFQNSTTWVRNLPGNPDGWSWASVKLAAGKFNADGYSDVTMLHQITDGGMHAHVLYGATGTPFMYNPTFARSLPGSNGWVWSLVKVV